MEELVDVIDEQDNPIAVAPKDECHENGLLHRCAAVYVLSPDGNLVVQKRSTEKQIAPGLLDHSAAGHIHAGESYEEGARRELAEELSIDAPLTLIGSARERSAHGLLTENQLFAIFLCEHDGALKIDPVEVDSADFWPLESVKRLCEEHPERFASGFKATFPLLVQHLAAKKDIETA